MCNYPVPLVLLFIIDFLIPSVLSVGILLKGGVFPFPYLFIYFLIYISKDCMGYHFIPLVIFCHCPYVFWGSNCPDLASGISFKLAPVSFNMLSSFGFPTCLHSDATRCSKLIWYFPCPDPGSSKSYRTAPISPLPAHRRNLRASDLGGRTAQRTNLFRLWPEVLGEGRVCVRWPESA